MADFEDSQFGVAERGFALMLSASIRTILRDESNPAGFLDWARGSLPVLLPDLTEPDGADAGRMAFWIARAVWNVTPLESNRYRPRPLANPQRNERCPCGSGRKFKQCCRNLPAVPELPSEVMWRVLIECLPDKHWIDTARSRTLPNLGLFAAAHVFVEHGRWRSLKDLAEAAIGEGVGIKDEELALLIDPLCDAYDALYRTGRRKRALLERLADHPLDLVSSAASQRLASWLHDQGEREAAWASLTRALRATPNDPAIAGLEISLLASEHAYERARERAGFWIRRLQRDQRIPDEALSFLEAVQSDPRRALADVSRDAAPPAIATLFDWIDQHAHRPVPELTWSPVGASSDDAWLQNAYQPLLRAKQEALIGDWQSRAQLDKPFSVQWMSGDEAQAWQRSDDWLPWLTSHPEALDSFEILDDLITVLFASAELTGLIEDPWVEVLIDRGVRMLLDHWPEARVGTLPWIIAENRPALRILTNAITQREQPDEVRSLVHAYLRLNPSDNHGFRAVLINELLQAGQDAEALQLSRRYEDDAMAEIVYGRVLALFRTGQRGEAINALIAAAENLPLVLDYLLRDRVAEPRVDPTRITLGGKDQAWLYRESMRQTWLTTDGLIEWMKPLAKKIRAKGRR